MNAPGSFRRSRRCETGHCVEVGRDDGQVLMRDSKLPRSPVLSFTPAAWAAFTAGVRAGEMEAPC